jgi:hypothetical protein
MEPAWIDPSLAVDSDSSRTARFRLSQSWYREHNLGVEAGPSRRTPDASDEWAQDFRRRYLDLTPITDA